MIKKPNLEEVKAMDLSHLYPLAVDNPDNRRLLRGEAGVEHYKLLAWLSNQFKNATLVEIGTLGGLGTIALANNLENFVISYDIRPHNWGNETPVNADKRLVDEGYMDEVVKASLIFYDAAHEGEEEWEFLQELIARGWHGMTVWDDIHLNPMMEEFWQKAKDAGLDCHDWTDLGHSCGTGVIFL